MAIVFFSGFETGDLGEWSSVTGSPSIEQANGWGAPRTGDYAMRCNPSSSVAYVEHSELYVYRATVSIYIATAPNQETSILGVNTEGRFHVNLTSDLYLKLYEHDDTLIDTGPTQLGTDRWYRVSVAGDTTTGKVWLDGVEECSGTMGRQTIVPVVGVITASTSADIYFDDFAVDQTPGGGDIGDIRVLRSSPNDAGEYAEFDTISGFGNCDEVPADDNDFVDDSGVEVLHRECYNLQDSATIGLGGSDTIKAVNVWARLYTDNVAQGIIVRDNSTDYTTMKDVGKAFAWANVLYDTNAPRGTAWTPAIFDDFQSGGYSEGKKDVYMSCVMVMVAFIPGAVGPPAGTVHLNPATGEHTQDTSQTPLRYQKTTGEITTLSTVDDYLVLDKLTGRFKSSAT